MNWKLLATVLLLPSVCLADPSEDKIVAVEKGEPAPFAGQLFDPPTALRWAHMFQWYELRLKADVLREQKACKAKLKYKQIVLDAEKDRARIVELDLKARLLRSEKARLAAEEEARNPPWYRSVWFGVGSGVVGTIAIVGVTAWALNAGK